MKRRFDGLLYYAEIGERNGRTVYRLTRSLRFWLDRNRYILVPKGFETDLASVPRLPIVYLIWGDRAHREAVLHDYCYRVGAVIRYVDGYTIEIPKEDADWYFRLAMISEAPEFKKKAQPYGIYQPMYLAVCCAGGSSFHRMNVMDSFDLDEAA